MGGRCGLSGMNGWGMSMHKEWGTGAGVVLHLLEGV